MMNIILIIRIRSYLAKQIKLFENLVPFSFTFRLAVMLFSSLLLILYVEFDQIFVMRFNDVSSIRNNKCGEETA